SVDPAFFGRPDDASGDGIFAFPTGSHTRPFWGGGFRAGVYCNVTDWLDVGFSYTSPQWLEKWKFYARDEIRRPETLLLLAHLPMILSGGVAVKPTDRLVLACDVRYFDYKNADLFGVPFVQGGLGWKSIVAVGCGVKYQLTDRLSLQTGYAFNDNPVPNIGTQFQSQFPVITQHTGSGGLKMDLNESISTALTYSHIFRNSVSGRVLEAVGANVTLDSEADTLAFGIYVKFGKPKKSDCPSLACCDPAPAAAPA